MPFTSSYARFFNDGEFVFDIVEVAVVFIEIFSASGLFGILSYIKLPSGALGGFGKYTFSGFGIFSFGVSINQSPPVAPGLPKRFAIFVTLPRFFFLYVSKDFTSVIGFCNTDVATEI